MSEDNANQHFFLLQMENGELQMPYLQLTSCFPPFIPEKGDNCFEVLSRIASLLLSLLNGEKNVQMMKGHIIS